MNWIYLPFVFGALYVLYLLSKDFMKHTKEIRDISPDNSSIVTKEYAPEVKNYVGINNDLIEEEILLRVAFKMQQFDESIDNIKKRLEFQFKNGTDREIQEEVRLGKALGILRERLHKETNMGGIYDGTFLERMREDKNKLVDEVMEVTLDRSDTHFGRKQSRVNNLIEKHIYKNTL